MFTLEKDLLSLWKHQLLLLYLSLLIYRFFFVEYNFVDKI